MRKIRMTIALLALALAAIGPPTIADAAPVEQACAYNAFRQADMTGVFVSSEYRMRLEIYPCGGSYLQWDNVYGTHSAGYISTIRLTGGGVGAVPMLNSIERLDNAPTVGFKPAEPGWIQVVTVGAYGDLLGVYRLRKIS